MCEAPSSLLGWGGERPAERELTLPQPPQTAPPAAPPPDRLCRAHPGHRGLVRPPGPGAGPPLIAARFFSQAPTAGPFQPDNPRPRTNPGPRAAPLAGHAPLLSGCPWWSSCPWPCRSSPSRSLSTTPPSADARPRSATRNLPSRFAGWTLGRCTRLGSAGGCQAAGTGRGWFTAMRADAPCSSPRRALYSQSPRGDAGAAAACERLE
jgi:hypothetical protein